MPNFRLTLCYDGTRYRGWQRQGNTGNTVQGKLETLLTRLLEQSVEVAGSGRTDAGAHARMQVASFRAKTELPAQEILTLLRRYLPEDIGAIDVQEAPPRFHARLSCTGKTYCYRVWNSAEPYLFQRPYLTAVPEPLDLAAMVRGAKLLCGTHDYRAFCSLKRSKKFTVRTVDSISIERMGEEVRFTVSGDGFLYNMVRILVGTLLEVGRGARSAESLAEVLASGDRQQAWETAPAKGLCLWSVRYGEAIVPETGPTV